MLGLSGCFAFDTWHPQRLFPFSTVSIVFCLNSFWWTGSGWSCFAIQHALSCLEHENFYLLRHLWKTNHRSPSSKLSARHLRCFYQKLKILRGQNHPSEPFARICNIGQGKLSLKWNSVWISVLNWAKRNHSWRFHAAVGDDRFPLVNKSRSLKQRGTSGYSTQGF